MGQFKQPKDLFFQLSLMEYKQWKALQRMFGDVANVYISCLDGQEIRMNWRNYANIWMRSKTVLCYTESGQVRWKTKLLRIRYIPT